MEANLRKLRKQRFFTEEFKKKIVADFESGRYSVLELVEKWQIRCRHKTLDKVGNINLKQAEPM